jgi:hypothetical protein
MDYSAPLRLTIHAEKEILRRVLSYALQRDVLYFISYCDPLLLIL